MAVTVENLFSNVKNLYKLKLLAGEKGLDNLVEWVHIIEDDNVSKFLHGNEVVFTTGVLNSGEGWLLNYAKKVKEAEVSAFVINLGPYTKEVPKEVIAYCNEVNMPLYTIPWETRMVDLTRDICYRIMKQENEEKSISETIKNIIFKIGDLETEAMQMERYGFERNSSFCFVVIHIDDSDNLKINEVMEYSEKISRGINDLFLAFLYNKNLVLVLINYEDDEVNKFVKDFSNKKNLKISNLNIYLGISENIGGYEIQSENFERAFKAMKMAVRKNESVIFYDNLGIYKLLLNIKDKNVLDRFYEKTLGKLEIYDHENGTDYEKFLKVYLDNNGSQQAVSQKLFIHRNTVTNQLKKIEKIIGIDEMDLKEKLKFLLAFYIKDIR